MNKKILVAAAWPYANGSLHLGHVSSLIGSDILARYFRLAGDKVLFVSGSDCHGTPIALEADRLGIKPAEIADGYHREFVETLINGLGFSYDLYTKTTTENHREVVQEVFLSLYRKGYIYIKTEILPYCANCQRFLPDRYIEGECPICHFSSARGDQCDNCGNLIDTQQLINPKCRICGSSPIWRESEHFFLKLSAFQEQIRDWITNSEGWRTNAKNFSLNLLKQGVPDRAITRDIEWGIAIPLPGYESKRIYVWFEAVCGYLSASKEWSQIIGQPEAWREWWESSDSIHYYVHGKDNIPFHTIIWPSILSGRGGLHLPDRIISSEYLNLEGRQFSKSRSWAVWLPDFLAKFDPETLRYFLVTNGPETADTSFFWKEYQTRINQELIGNFGNFVYRTLSFIKARFPRGVSFPTQPDEESYKFLALAQETFSSVGESIEAGRFREGLRSILRLVETGNRYLSNAAPWVSIKTNPAKTENDLAVTAHVIKCLVILVSPFLPKTAERILKDIGSDPAEINWSYPVQGVTVVSETVPLYKKIETSEIEEQLQKLGSESPKQIIRLRLARL
ncbi:methionine--tRNA ligase [Candidatus Falkowbacteria bacterium]|nr:methionine--tRNA ligase [Candidatus Falkowbacteria bacterium]